MKFFMKSGLILMLAVAAGQTAEKTAVTPSAADLIAPAPRIALGEKDIQSFDVYGVFSMGEMKMRFEVFGRAPGQTALRIFDMRDRTPVLAGSTNGVALYDPLVSEVVIVDSVPYFVLEVSKDRDDGEKEPHRLSIGFGVNSPPESSDSKKDDSGDGSVIDIKALMGMLKDRVKVEEAANGEYILRGYTSRGNRAVAFVEPGRAEGAYRRLELYQKDELEPFVVLDRIVLNQNTDDRNFLFMRDKILKSGLKTRVLKSDGVFSIALLMKSLMRTMVVRMAVAGMDSPELTQALTDMCGHKPDLKQLRGNDAKAGKILRAVLPAMSDVVPAVR